jgi:hypothetical protein
MSGNIKNTREEHFRTLQRWASLARNGQCKRGPVDGYVASCMIMLFISSGMMLCTQPLKSLFGCCSDPATIAATLTGAGPTGISREECWMGTGMFSPYQEAEASPPTLKCCLAACHRTSADGSLVRSPMDEVGNLLPHWRHACMPSLEVHPVMNRTLVPYRQGTVGPSVGNPPASRYAYRFDTLSSWSAAPLRHRRQQQRCLFPRAAELGGLQAFPVYPPQKIPFCRSSPLSASPPTSLCSEITLSRSGVARVAG